MSNKPDDGVMVKLWGNNDIKMHLNKNLISFTDFYGAWVIHQDPCEGKL